MIYITFFIVILIDKRDDKKEQLKEGADTSTVIGTSTDTKYKVQDTSTKRQVPSTRIQVPRDKVLVIETTNRY